MSESHPEALPSILEASNLSISLGGKSVLDIPSLQVFPGEVLFIIGPNGSGKTTLLLSLALLLKPDGGAIYYHEHAINGSSLNMRRRFAVVFQEPLLLNSSVWDNVTLGLRMRGFNKNEQRARASMWLERFGVASLAGRQARTLSGGEAKRVSLARAFALQPEVLFLDEPFAALDAPTHQALIEDFESVLGETRTTVVMVTHDRNEALVLADRVAVLMSGRIRQMGSPQEVFSLPVDEEVAGFVGAANIIPGVVASQSRGLVTLDAGDYKLEAVGDLAVGTKAAAFLRHEDVTISLASPQGSQSSARNRLAGKVARVFTLGSQLKVTVDCGFPLTALITSRSWEDMGMDIGSEVVVSFKASSVHLIPRR